MNRITFIIEELSEQLGDIDSVTGARLDDGPWVISGTLSFESGMRAATKTCEIRLLKSEYRNIEEHIESLRNLVQKGD